MNYIQEINKFYDWLETNSLSSSAINMWHTLMHIANKTGWQPKFAVAISVLEIKTGLKKQAINAARNSLKQAGRIEFESRSGNQSAVYRIISFEGDKRPQTHPQTHTQTHPQTHTQTHPINKLNKTKLNKTREREENPPSQNSFENENLDNNQNSLNENQNQNSANQIQTLAKNSKDENKKQKGGENSENNKASATVDVSKYIDIPIKECKKLFLSDEAHIETLERTLKLTPIRVQTEVEIYFKEQEAKGVQNKSLSDAKMHFVNWYNYHKPKEQAKQNAHNTLHNVATNHDDHF